MKGLIDKVNWPDQFPEKPEVSFSLENCGEYLRLHFTVNEKSSIARAKKHFDHVWEDSCCEMFISFNDEGKYYNLETSCNGYQVFSYRTDRFDPEDAPMAVMNTIEVETSLEKGGTFEERPKGEWSLDIKIPASAFWRSGLSSFENVRARGNFYKCGDNLSTAHYVSWAPIDIPAPDFHRPEFFKPIDF